MNWLERSLLGAARGARAVFVLCFALVFLFFMSGDAAGGAGEGGAVKAADSESAVAEPSHEMALSGADCHSQGITVKGGRLYVSCVERKNRKALLYSYEWPARFAEAVELSDPLVTDVTRGRTYHPSGLDHDAECVWAALSHYRSFMARSSVICLDPKSLEGKSSFMVDDHIGALAVMGSDLVLMNWDARTFYRYSRKGDRLGRRPSPTGVAYQDCRGMSDTTILCSGKAKGGEAASVDLLAFDPGSGWSLSRRTLISRPGISLGREGFTVIAGHWAFLPEDFPGARLMICSPPVSRP
jgi:hypothetical protein